MAPVSRRGFFGFLGALAATVATGGKHLLEDAGVPVPNWLYRGNVEGWRITFPDGVNYVFQGVVKNLEPYREGNELGARISVQVVGPVEETQIPIELTDSRLVQTDQLDDLSFSSDDDGYYIPGLKRAPQEFTFTFKRDERT